jgi:hypothetical protein
MTTALEGGEGSASRPIRSLPPGKTRYPLYRRLGWPQGRSGQVRNVSPPTEIRSPDRPARSQSLYRPRYTAHINQFRVPGKWLAPDLPESNCCFSRGGSLFHSVINPLNPELNPICHLLPSLGTHHFLHVSRIRVKSLTLRLLMSYIWSTYSWCI